MFSKQAIKLARSNVFLRGEELDLVYEYLGVTLDSTITFKPLLWVLPYKLSFHRSDIYKKKKAQLSFVILRIIGIHALYIKPYMGLSHHH